MQALLLSVLSASLLLVSFYWMPSVIFISFVPLFWVCYNRKKVFKFTFLTGALFGGGLLYWVSVVDAPVKMWLWLGLFLLFLYFGFVFAVTLCIPIWCKRFFLIPVSWTFFEFLRSLTNQIGFPWGTMGYALVPHIAFLQIAEFVGLPGVTFFILTVNLLVFYTVQKKKLLYIYIAIGLVFIIWVEGKLRLRQGFDKGEKIRVAFVQPSISAETKRSGVLEYRLELLYKLSSEVLPCDLIVWPESAIPGYFNLGDRTSQVVEIVDSLGVPVLMGSGRVEFLDGKKYKVYNSCFLVAPGAGVVGFYDKKYLVPFSEKLPFDDVLPLIKKLEFGQGDFSPGEVYKVFEFGQLKFSTLICFESIFPRLTRKFVRQGAKFLVNITDDSWFGRSAGPYQHSAQAVLRAIEYRIPIVRCGDTGISFFITPKGETEYRTELFTREAVARDIYLNEKESFYARYGDWFGWLCGILLLIGLFIKL